jgi:serine phosphatase RsbU (regulator of sigma subunit)
VASGGDGTIGSGPRALRPPGLTTPPRGRGLHSATVMVLVIGAVISGVLCLGARSLRSDNEDRLLRQRAQQAATVAGAAVPTIQVPLASATALAQTSTGPDQAREGFAELLKPIVKLRSPFVSASLWEITDGTPRRVTGVGIDSDFAQTKLDELQAFVSAAARTDTLKVVDLLDGEQRRIGYAFASPDKGYVAYAEGELPRDRRAAIDEDSAFADLDYALYLGSENDPAKLLASSVGGDVPLEGRVDEAAVPFGDEQLLIVLRPRSDLGGTLLVWLPWALLIAGIVFTLAAAALAEWLIRRREHAEALARELEIIADENARLLADQRTVAYTLQHSLLPDRLPDVDGLDLGVRYVAGVEGVDIGGDWYDVMTMDDGRVFFVVGDVSGRGLRAATVMASLRYSIRAYATQGDDPATVLTKLSNILSVSRDGSFATVLCGVIDVPGHRVTIASAGHPYPLLVSNGQSTFVSTLNGVPVGVAASAEYESVTMSMPTDATLLVFTDGLVERRGEALDTGFERLRVAAFDTNGSLEDLLTKVVADVSFAGSEDDTAVLGIRWRG